jgi:ribonuclease P protein component
VAELNNKLQQKERLRKRQEFLRVYREGEKLKNSRFFVYFLENSLPHSRLGLTVSRRLGKSYIRNQLKRRLREVFRKNKELVKPTCDLVINTTSTTCGASYEELEKDFVRVANNWRKGFHGEDATTIGCPH